MLPKTEYWERPDDARVTGQVQALPDRVWTAQRSTYVTGTASVRTSAQVREIYRVEHRTVRGECVEEHIDVYRE